MLTRCAVIALDSGTHGDTCPCSVQSAVRAELHLLMDDAPEIEEADPLDDPDNLRIDDLDPDMFDEGMPEDF